MIKQDNRPDPNAWKDISVVAKPRAGFACIIREDAQQYTSLLLPGDTEGKRKLMAEARVIAIGDPAIRHDGQEIPVGFEVGDRVLTQGYNGFCTHKVNPWSDLVYELIAHNQVAAVLDEAPVVELPEPADEPEEEPEPEEEVPTLTPLLDANGVPVIGAQ